MKLLNLLLNLFQRQKINLAHYPIRMDYGTMNAQQRNAFDNFLPLVVKALFDLYGVEYSK